MGYGIAPVADTIFNAGTSVTGWSSGGGTGAAALASRILPAELGGTARNCVTFTGSAVNTAAFPVLATPGSTATRTKLHGWIYVDLSAAASPGTCLGEFRFRTAGNTDQWQALYDLHHGWNPISLNRSDFTLLAGAPSWASSTWSDLMFKVNGVSGVTHSISIANMGWGGPSRSLVSFHMDDGNLSVINLMKPILDTFGFKGTVGVISSLVASTGKMTLANLNTLHDAGYANVNHSATHGASPFLTVANQAACLAEIQTCKTYLEAQGWTRDGENLDYFAPYGEWSPAYVAAAAQAGMRSFRGLGLNDVYVGEPTGSALGGISNWPMNCLSLTSTTPTLAQMLAKISSAVYNGRPISILCHSLDHTGDNCAAALNVGSANFTAVVQHVHRLNAFCDVVTWPQMMKILADPT